MEKKILWRAYSYLDLPCIIFFSERYIYNCFQTCHTLWGKIHMLDCVTLFLVFNFLNLFNFEICVELLKSMVASKMQKSKRNIWYIGKWKEEPCCELDFRWTLPTTIASSSLIQVQVQSSKPLALCDLLKLQILSHRFVASLCTSSLFYDETLRRTRFRARNCRSLFVILWASNLFTSFLLLGSLG